jgi:hypothetical protein
MSTVPLSDTTTCEVASSCKVRKQRHEWSQMAKQLIIAKCRSTFAGNRSRTVDWFHSNFAGQELGEVSDSNLQYWMKPVRPETKPRGVKSAIPCGSVVYTETLDLVQKCLNAGMPGVAPIMGPIITGFLKSKYPGVIKEHFKRDEVSERWTQDFLFCAGLVMRKPTKIGHKLPLDWKEQKKMYILRLAWLMDTKAVPPELVVAFDHTGMQIVPIKPITRARAGASDVYLQGIDDKRQITAGNDER